MAMLGTTRPMPKRLMIRRACAPQRLVRMPSGTHSSKATASAPPLSKRCVRSAVQKASWCVCR